MKKTLLFLLLALLVIPVVLAVDQQANINTQITQEEKDQFDQILQPVVKIYHLVKYVSSMVAAVYLVFAGMTYMSSGTSPQKRDQAKGRATYVILGLLIVWASPSIIGMLI